MAAVTEPSTRRDAKAGYCQPCREGRCALCASDRCACPDRRKHRNRPGFGSPDAPRPPRSLTREAKPAGPAAVVFELVEADPPEPPKKPKKLTNAEKVRPLLEQLVVDGKTSWHRLAVHPSSRGAGFLASAFRKAYPRSEWEFKAVAIPEVGQSAVYVRWLGSKAGVL